jgi:hypothetical protein
MSSTEALERPLDLFLTSKMHTKWSEIGKMWAQNLSPNSKNVKNEVKIQKFEKNYFSNFSNFSKIISREIREKKYFEFLEKFSRRTQGQTATL